MHVLLDENVDRRLKEPFDDDFEVTTVTERGWNGKNGELFRAAEHEFDALSSIRNCKTSEVTFRALLAGEASEVQLALG
jgi:hypothetical protein